MNKRRWTCWWAIVVAVAVMSIPAVGDVQVGLGCRDDYCAGIWPPDVSAGFQLLSIGSATQYVPMSAVTYASGTMLTIGDGLGSTFLIADINDAQIQFYPTPPGDNNPNSGYTYSANLIVTYVDPSYFNGAACVPGVCGTGTFDASSIWLNQSADISVDVDLATSLPDPPTDPTTEPSTILLWLSGAVLCWLAVKNRLQFARR